MGDDSQGLDVELATSEVLPSGQARRTSLFHADSWAAERNGHRVSSSQYIAIGTWLFQLLLVYGFVCVVCDGLGIPEDCRQHTDVALLARDVQFLMFSGFTQAVLTGMNWPDRFQYVFCFSGRCWYHGPLFLAILFFSSFAWGTLDSIPDLGHQAFTPGFDTGKILLLIVTSLGAVAIISWHVRLAYKCSAFGGFLAYTCSRLLIVAMYAFFILLAGQDVSFHVHHYVIAYVAASFAEFNHPISLVLLAVSTGVYVQGIAAYGADPVISHTNWFVTMNVSGHKVVSPVVSRDAAEWIVEYCH
eukprot:TRINITY_DN46703_c0_g1_i1.p1 TRINITY_DN46703_c0_g1~~TRINITY_DN46703_c0_g1_i1.p1  ORF type:complete len:302 (+),score=24.68 TRINITY_DN46703_c0_g1_i1:44-949(+)